MPRQVWNIILLLFIGVGVIAAQPPQPIPGQIIVRFQPNVSPKSFVNQLNTKRSTAFQISSTQSLGQVSNTQLLSFDPYKVDTQQLLEELRHMPEVIAAQFNYELQARQTPDDPEFEKQWGLARIGAPEVWDYTTGGLSAQGDEIVVAILDFGFDIQHEDLQHNIWQNPGEIPNDGIDNDNNGYVDDLYGWNFATNSKEHSRDSHGTSVAGIIGANGNNSIGITGINWQVKMIPFTIVTVANIISAYEYVIEQRRLYNESNGKQGAFIVATNLSLGIDQVFCEDQPVWGGMYDLLGEVGVLTGAATANRSWDVDQVGDMPTTCTSDFLITSLNMTSADQIYSGSAYGLISIDLGAPGEGSYSAKIGNRYGSFNDNSAAAPHLTGVIALLYSLPCEALTENALTQPAQTALAIRQAILEGVEKIDVLKDKTGTGGRLNVFKSMEILQNRCATSTGDLAVTKIFPNPGTEQITIEFETPDFEPYNLFIYNALGQLVFRNSITPQRFSKKRQWIDVQNWTPGVYFLTLEREKSRVQAKFIVY